ncbi:MAG TPA: LLM class flavin-dependent oxidoreductase, partial [Acidimicrobiia bacterium]
MLGLALDAWSGADVELPVARVQLAERLGYDSVWTAEAYGADALTPLAYLAASTRRIKLATGVVQISAR